MIKQVFGLSGLIVVGCCAVWIMTVGFSNAKVSNFQLNATQCLNSNGPTSKECKRMAIFGISPSIYINNVEYRKEVDSKYMRAIELNANIAPKIAKYTLEYGVTNKVKLVESVYKQLIELSTPNKNH